MENKRFFFVIGMPRTRTAWMSVLLSQGDSICLHEGTKNFPTFAAYAAHLRSLPYAAVGDSNSTLVFNIQELLEEFPDADIWFINRDHTEALESLIKTSPAMEIAVRGMWPAYCAAWESAKDYCFEKDRHYNFGGWEMLRDIHFCRALYGSCTGNAIGAEKVKALQDLRITAMAEAPASVPPPQFPPVDHSGAGLSVESLADAGCDLSGLTVQQIQLSDLKMIAGWWKDHDDVGMLPEKLLPPLGVLVSDGAGPCFALWCYENYGVGVASLEYPVSRPGMTRKQSMNAAAFAVLACVKLAGKLVEPPAEYKVFRITTLPALAAVLRRLGFVRSGREWVNMIFRNE